MSAVDILTIEYWGILVKLRYSFMKLDIEKCDFFRPKMFNLL